VDIRTAHLLAFLCGFAATQGAVFFGGDAGGEEDHGGHGGGGELHFVVFVFEFGYLNVWGRDGRKEL
jgi:hypothetical protein